MYDVASLTKVVVTTTLVEKLVEGDFPSPLDLDAPIERYLPEWIGGPPAESRHKVTVKSPQELHDWPAAAASRVAPQGHRAASDDAHVGLAAVQGILAHVEGQSRHAERIFSRSRWSTSPARKWCTPTSALF